MAAGAARRGDGTAPTTGSDSGSDSWVEDIPRPIWVADAIPVGGRDDATLIDCDRCAVRGVGCGDCVVTVLLGAPPYDVELDEVEERALGVLADAGLVPPLRMAQARELPDG